MFAVDVQIGDGNGGLLGYFALDSKAGLLHARSYEVGGEGGNVVGDTLGESDWETARCGSERAGYEWVGIGRKDLVFVIVGVLEEQLSVGNAVIGCDGGVVDLGNADEEQSIAGT